MIDGIRYYKYYARRNDTCKVLAMLAALTYDKELNVVFKLMISNPTTSRYVSKTVEPEDTYNLPETIGRKI